MRLAGAVGLGGAGVVTAILVAFAANGQGSWPVVRSNSQITDIPKLGDFVQVGTVYEETAEHILRWTKDPKWRLT